jgi:general stress protein 26
MAMKQPKATLDKRYSSATATARAWEEGRSLLEKAEIYWLTTVRADGRPNVSALAAIWLDGAIHFCTGEHERKALNIASNRQCAITTGCNAMNEGFDVVIEGDAIRVLDRVKLQRVADAYGDKYAGWGLTVGEGVLLGEDGDTLVFEIVPVKAFGFGKGEPFSQTRWDF